MKLTPDLRARKYFLSDQYLICMCQNFFDLLFFCQESPVVQPACGDYICSLDQVFVFPISATIKNHFFHAMMFYIEWAHLQIIFIFFNLTKNIFSVEGLLQRLGKFRFQLHMYPLEAGIRLNETFMGQKYSNVCCLFFL